MSDTTVAVAEVETRQMMVRVWMAISAIWVAFWLCIAAVIVVTGERAAPLTSQFQLFAFILMAPPLALLALGAVFRWAFAALFRKSSNA